MIVLTVACGEQVPAEKIDARSSKLASSDATPLPIIPPPGNAIVQEASEAKKIIEEEYSKPRVSAENIETITNILENLGTDPTKINLKQFSGDFYLLNIGRDIGDEYVSLNFRCSASKYDADTWCGIKEVPDDWFIDAQAFDSSRSFDTVKLNRERDSGTVEQFATD